MVPPVSSSATHGNQALAELFLCDGGFSLSDDAAAYRHFSRKLSVLLDRPVVVVNQADLRHAYENPFDIPICVKKFSDEQIADRIEDLAKICADTLPQEPSQTWEAENLLFNTAVHASANAGTLRGRFQEGEKTHGLLKSRLEGECWYQAAIILVPDRRWSEKSMWALRIGLDEKMIRQYPRGPGQKLLSFFHELCHVLQLSHWRKGDLSPEAMWQFESDADVGSIEYGMAMAEHPLVSPDIVRSLKTAIAWEAPVRALARFLNSPDFYGTALVIDRHLKGIKAPDFSRVRAIAEELRWRCYEMLLISLGKRQGIEPMSPHDRSRIVQNTTNAFHANNLSDPRLTEPLMEACNLGRRPADYASTLSILEKVLREHPVTDPLTRHEAKLVLRAWRFSSGSPRGTDTEVTGDHIKRSEGNGTSQPVQPAIIPPQAASQKRVLIPA